MTHKDIFKKAWELSVKRKYKKLIWYGIIPALFTTALSTIVYSFRGYQYYFELVQGGDIKNVLLLIFNTFIAFISANPGLLVGLAIGILLFTLGYIFLPILFHSALVKVLPGILREEPFKFRMGILYAYHYFLKLFELRAILSPFRFAWVAIAYWAIRVFNPEALAVLWIPLVLWLIVALLVNFMFIFTEFFILLKDNRVFESIRNSIELVFINFEEVFRMLFLIILIEIRIILNAFFIIGIPLLILFIGGFFASAIVESIVTILAVIVGIALLLLLTYINAIITVFVYSAWTMLFMKLQHIKMTAPDPSLDVTYPKHDEE